MLHELSSLSNATCDRCMLRKDPVKSVPAFSSNANYNEIEQAVITILAPKLAAVRQSEHSLHQACREEVDEVKCETELLERKGRTGHPPDKHKHFYMWCACIASTDPKVVKEASLSIICPFTKLEIDSKLQEVVAERHQYMSELIYKEVNRIIYQKPKA
ncbi:hypothetical protein CPC08DRAFT_725507 [Agrocybe pediades]|nr:hypothetical protein CPC08DRAFT_725507 [Agrocybe pediades]